MTDKAGFRLAPFISCFDFLRLGDALQKLEKTGSAELVFPIGDGKIAPFMSGLDIMRQISRLTELQCHALLMVEFPERYIQAFANAGCSVITISLETSRHHHRTLSAIREAGLKSGLAVNPATSLVGLEYLLETTDRVCLFGVEPGSSNNMYATPALLERVKMLHENIRYRELQTEIMVCGGITFDLAKKAKTAGASIIGVDSALVAEEGECNVVVALKNFSDKLQTK